MTATRRERHRERHVVIRGAVVVAGFAALLGGLALLVLPGPGIAVIAVGLGLLALEFAWAERLLRYVKRRTQRVTPSRRRHQVALGAAAAALAVTGIVAAAIWL